MAKTEFTGIRVERAMNSLTQKLSRNNDRLSANIEAFEVGDQSACVTRRNYNTLQGLFVKLCRHAMLYITVANKVDDIRDDSELYYLSDDFIREIDRFHAICRFFKR